jgi:hypothetical protein
VSSDDKDWRIGIDAEDYLLSQKKQNQMTDRRPVIRKSSDLAGMGPAINAGATLLADFNDPLATYNGFFSAEVDALNAPNDDERFIGFVTQDNTFGGKQTFTGLTSAIQYTRIFLRDVLDASHAVFGDWVGTPTPLTALDVYPVGAIYMSVISLNPEAIFGGTWVAWGTGRVPVGVDTGDGDFNTVEETGGEKTHLLTALESGLRTHLHDMSHSHSFNVKWEDNTVEGGAGTAIRVKNVDNLTGAGGGFEGNASLPLSANTALSGAFDAVNAHNNLQPYITCYMWKRTA